MLHVLDGPRRRGIALAAAVFTLSGLAIACAGDDILGPPDGAACTVGTIAAGEAVDGELSEESCAQYSAKIYWESRADSWTLRAARNTAYVVRLRPADDDFLGFVSAYVRSPNGGDAMFATSGELEFGTGGRSTEMFLVSDADRTISLRVETNENYGFGEYTLEVESCPLTMLADGEEVEDVDVDEGCLSMAFDPRYQSRVRLLAFRAHPDSSVVVETERTAGAGHLRARLVGPGLDLNGATDGSIFIPSVPDRTEFTFTPEVSRAGLYTLALGVHRDSSATVRVEAGQQPVKALLLRSH